MGQDHDCSIRKTGIPVKALGPKAKPQKKTSNKTEAKKLLPELYEDFDAKKATR